MANPPPLPTLFQIATDDIKMLEDLIKLSGPLLSAGRAFSQVLGRVLASQDNHQPPDTYYIGDPDPSSPTQRGRRQQPSGPVYTPIAVIDLDTVLGKNLPGIVLGVYAGPHMKGVAFAVASPATRGNPAIIGGSGFLLAPVGGSTSMGAPIVDEYDEGVHMAMPMSHNADGKHAIYTVGGRGSEPQDGSPKAFAQRCGADSRVAQHYLWCPVEYPAELFPMAANIKQGIDDLVRKIIDRKGTFALVGYSLGSIVTCKVWRDEIMNPNGQLHDRLGDIFAHVNFGNPMRCPGKANGNGLAKVPMPEPLEGYVTGGIAGPDDLTPWQTPAWQMDFAHDGDVWTSCPVGADPWANESPVGEAETSVYNIFMEKFFGQDTITAEIGELLIHPIPNLVAIVEALVNVFGFFAAGQGPHDDYDEDGSLEAAIEFLVARGQSVPT